MTGLLLLAALLQPHMPAPPWDVGVLYWSANIPGQVAMAKGLEAEAKAYNQTVGPQGRGVRLVVRVAGDGHQGVENQRRQMFALVAQQVDAIIVQPTDVAALSEPLLAANKAGIPVVAYDQYIMGGRLASFVTSDNRQAGVIDGEYIAARFPDDQTIKLVLVEYPRVSSTVARLDGFLATLKALKQPYVVLRNYHAVEPVEGAKAGRQILADFPERGSVDVVFTVNDGGGLAVVDALAKAGRDEIMVASVDGDPASVENIKAGRLTVIDAAQFCGPLGAAAMKLMIKVLKKVPVPRRQLVPTFPITRETLDRYPGWMGPMPAAFTKAWTSLSPQWAPTLINEPHRR